MLTIKYCEKFLRDAKRLKKDFPKIASDIKELENLLKTSKVKGDLITGLSGLQIFKIRQKNSSINSGKSGGFRVIYYQITEDGCLVMLTIYSKTKKDNISRKEILDIVNQLK